MRVIAIGGMPASGKTTLMRALMKRIGVDTGTTYTVPLLKWHETLAGDVKVMGDYTAKAGTFGGTDRLSMACQEYARRQMEGWQASRETRAVLFEGDRLVAPGFLEALKGSGRFEMSLWVLETSHETRAQRSQQRGDTQSETWKKGRKTKLENLKKRFDHQILQHDTPEDTSKIVESLARLVRTAKP